MPPDDPKVGSLTTQSKSSLSTYQQGDDYVVIDTLKVRLQRPGNTRHDGAASETIANPRQPKEISDQYLQNLHALPASADACEPNALEQSGADLGLCQDHPDIRPFERPTPRSQPCDACLQFYRHCDRQLPTCGACSEAAEGQCTWTFFGEQSGITGQVSHTSQPTTSHHPAPPFMPSCDDHTSYDLDFATLDDTTVLENFDFDAFLKDENYGSWDAGNGLDGEETNYWRNTIAAAEPMADVERPRPRPR